METRNLEFYKAIEGSKTHFIFTQGEKFYVFTELDGETRGNFSVIRSSEIEEIEILIGKLRLNQFHPKDLDKYDFETNKDYRVQRIRDICYILVAKHFLEIEKVGREILFNCYNPIYFKAKASKANSFSENLNLRKKSKQKNRKRDQISLKDYLGICPLCKHNVPKHNIETHLNYTCPKR